MGKSVLHSYLEYHQKGKMCHMTLIFQIMENTM